MEYQIALLKGDGIGPEIVESAVAVLEKTGKAFGFTMAFHDYLLGGAAIDKTGVPLPQETIDGCLASDSVLLGAVGGPKWDDLPANIRPEKGLLQIRSILGLYTNLRPARLYPALAEKCMLRPDLVANGFDLVIVRELTGGIYFGERGRRTGKYGPEAYDTECYSVMEIERIARVAFSAAQKRRGKVTSVDKANVLESSRLWRETVHRVAEEYEGVTVEDMLVDNTAQQLIRNPAQFDVIVTSNMFGDILSDEMSQLTGSIGMLPSASLGDGTRGLYEPIHGSAPKYAGTGRCNPIATILSGAMMLRYSLNQNEAADCIENAVDQALSDGCRTRDIAGPEDTELSCTEMTKAILQRIKL
ncbi:MAG: 3-isopropylmalate dehydrogenase [Oscillospiraceae bacterium]|nr:3-isopropylmalate dehydrogenase [Oscillospiraceae bacterium]